jgi:RNA polymerase sigma factor
VLGLFKKQFQPLEKKIEQIQNGDRELRNQFIEQYKPFVLSTTSEICKRYIRKTDDEYSVALIAFNEAISSYDPTKGVFFTFAKRVIYNRLIDFLRKETKQDHSISLDARPSEEEKEEFNDVLLHTSVQAYQHELDARSRKEEIEQFSSRLQEFGLSFSELVKVSPKHRDTREQSISLAKLLYSHEAMRQFVLQYKKIPVKQLMQYSGAGEKMIERNRKYILSIFVLLLDDYPYMHHYLSLTKEG